jgi:alkylation response protein AidB-like acyl-CoA dehydrogenase
MSAAVRTAGAVPAGLLSALSAQRDDGERDRSLPGAAVAAMREAGLLRLWTPKEYGGDEVDLRTAPPGGSSPSRRAARS